MARGRIVPAGAHARRTTAPLSACASVGVFVPEADAGGPAAGGCPAPRGRRAAARRRGVPPPAPGARRPAAGGGPASRGPAAGGCPARGAGKEVSGRAGRARPGWAGTRDRVLSPSVSRRTSDGRRTIRIGSGATPERRPRGVRAPARRRSARPRSRTPARGGGRGRRRGCCTAHRGRRRATPARAPVGRSERCRAPPTSRGPAPGRRRPVRAKARAARARALPAARGGRLRPEGVREHRPRSPPGIGPRAARRHRACLALRLPPRARRRVARQTARPKCRGRAAPDCRPTSRRPAPRRAGRDGCGRRSAPATTAPTNAGGRCAGLPSPPRRPREGGRTAAAGCWCRRRAPAPAPAPAAPVPRQPARTPAGWAPGHRRRAGYGWRPPSPARRRRAPRPPASLARRTDRSARRCS